MPAVIPAGFPRLYAAASLKLPEPANGSSTIPPFSAALCRGLIEALHAIMHFRIDTGFSAALCRGLIEARITARLPHPQ